MLLAYYFTVLLMHFIVIFRDNHIFTLKKNFLTISSLMFLKFQFLSLYIAKGNPKYGIPEKLIKLAEEENLELERQR